MAKKLSFDASALSALLSAVDISNLTTEQQQAITAMKTEVVAVEKSEKLESAVKQYDDILLENAKGILSELPLDISPVVSVIRLTFDYNAESKTFVPNDRLDTTKSIPGVLSDCFLYFRANLLDGASKAMSDKVTIALNDAAKQAYHIDDYNDMIEDFLLWDHEQKPIVEEYNTQTVGDRLMGNISFSEEIAESITKGSVVISYNSADMINKAAGAEAEAKVKSGSWSVTTSSFNKSTKYTPKKKADGTTNGTRSNAKNWIPEHSKATTAMEYMIEQFSEVASIAKALDKHTIDGVLNTKSINATSNISTAEKQLPEDQRYYTNWKTSQ